MATHISPELERFVEREVASGRFADRKSVIEHALRLLQRDREEAVLGIQAGLDDIAAGRTQPLDNAFDDLRRELGISKDS
jgi:putative addiction module CopG family antidote